MRTGLFTRADARDAAKKKPKARAAVSSETLHTLGPAAVRGMNPRARSPEMRPTGAKRPEVYFLGEAPGQVEDEQGKPFVGASGMRLRQVLGRNEKKCRFDNVVRTRPPENRNPTATEIECFRPSVVKSIEKAKPLAIVGLGRFAGNWATGYGSAETNRGRRFPIQVGKHTCWFYPTYHPSFILRAESEKPSRGKPPGEEVARFWEADIDRVFDDLDDLPQPKVVDKKIAGEGIEIISDLKSLRRVLRLLGRSDRTKAFDLETHGLRPYGDGRVLSCSLSDGRRTFAFGIDHDQSPFKGSDRKKLLKLLRKFFTAGHTIAAHNLAFDLEWLIDLLGPEVAFQTRWEDSMQAAYTLDVRKGGLSLDYLCQLEFGLPLKSLTFAGTWKKRLHEMDLQRLLPYNGLDAKWTARLLVRLRKRINAEKLYDVYRSQVDRVRPCVLAQREGVPIDQKVRTRFSIRYADQLEDVTEKIRRRPEVREFEQTKGRLNPSSSEQLTVLFRDQLGREEGVTKAGGYSTDEGHLKLMKGVPLAKLILEHRKITKQKGTYCDRFDPDVEDSYVWPDGRMHCIFKTAKTDTGRLASAEPNNQNWPKRSKEGKKIRKMIVAPRGYIILAADYGQIEARVLGMASEDETFCKALWEDYDIHMEWTKRIAKMHPPVLDLHGGDLKRMRTAIKNELVFPAFYGASPNSIAGYIGLPANKARKLFSQFWKAFPGVAAWHDDVRRFYQAHNYVECLTGRRRYGPLNFNMQVNSPIQGTASDIVVAAMIELSDLAWDEDKPWLQPVLNIHDDLTFLIPKEKKEEAIEIITRVMLKIRWDWINVPLSVELEQGRDWYNMNEIGTFRSDKVAA